MPPRKRLKLAYVLQSYVSAVICFFVGNQSDDYGPMRLPVTLLHLILDPDLTIGLKMEDRGQVSAGQQHLDVSPLSATLAVLTYQV